MGLDVGAPGAATVDASVGMPELPVLSAQPLPVLSSHTQKQSAEGCNWTKFTDNAFFSNSSSFLRKERSLAFFAEHRKVRNGSRQKSLCRVLNQKSEAATKCCRLRAVFPFVSFLVSDCAPVMPFKFSKDKFWLEPPSEKLRKLLEEELKLSGSNLKSHAWYHGYIPWEVHHKCTHNYTHITCLTTTLFHWPLVLSLHPDNSYLEPFLSKMELSFTFSVAE